MATTVARRVARSMPDPGPLVLEEQQERRFRQCVVMKRFIIVYQATDAGIRVPG